MNSFVPAPARLGDERARRLANARRALSFHHAFLDDALRGILPHDLILIGADTGAGKTDLATAIAKSNAKAGKRVNYIALEAEPDEIERRIKYSLIMELAYKDRDARAMDLNYPDWMFGRCEEVAGPYDDRANQLILERFSRLFTFYRGAKFGDEEIRTLFGEAQKGGAELIVLDHAHYVDIDDVNENRGFKATVMQIRDLSLRVGIPVVLIAHLRKRDQRAKRVIPLVDDFHGSSDLSKICTQIVQLAPVHGVEAPWWEAPTYFAIPKDRRGGSLRQVARCSFDHRFRAYAATYTLGELVDGGTSWEPLAPLASPPKWATRHKPEAA